MSSYYSDLAYKRTSAQRVGWYDTLDQAFRHGLVRATLGDISHVTDLGCGEGDFVRQIDSTTGYLGVDNRAEFIDNARARFPERTFVLADLEAAPTADACVAIGVFVGSVTPLDALLEAVSRTGGTIATVLVLKTEWLATRAVFDPALRGASEEELERFVNTSGRYARISGDILRTDWLLELSSTPLPPRPDIQNLVESAIRSVNCTPADEARLAYHLGDRARLQRLSRAHPTDELVQLSCERFEFETSR